MLKVIGLDFDGVVLESVGIKLQAFYDLFAGHPRSAAINDYLRTHNGIDRYTKFKFIHERFLGKDYNPNVEAAIDARFSALVLEKILACPFVPGAEQFVKSAPLPVYVVSAMPLRELKIIVERRGLPKFFRGLYGSPGTKKEQLLEIISKEGIAPSEMLYVGDSLEDCKAAVAAGVQFVGRDNEDDFSSLAVSHFPNLTDIGLHVKGLVETRKESKSGRSA